MNNLKKCDECQKEFDPKSLQACRLTDPDGGEDQIEFLCDDCIEGSGYCRSCGEFCAGMERFDFGPGKGFCDNCWDQIETDSGDGYRDEDEYPYGSFD